jgi:hypothetical protein
MSAKMYNYLATYRVKFGQADPELLVSNPCSINIRSPKTIGNLLRQGLENILIQVTKNKDLSNVFSEKAKTRDQEFFEYLIKTQPCHPRILHEILRNTIQVAKLSYISKYKNTKTTRILCGKVINLEGMTQKLNKIQANCISEWVRLFKSVRQTPV